MMLRRGTRGGLPLKVKSRELQQMWRGRTLRLMGIQPARLDTLALSASGHERVVNDRAEASGEESVDFVRTIRLFR